MAITNSKLELHDLHIADFTKELEKQGIWLTTAPVKPLHPAQIEIVEDPHRFKVVVCGRRFGKSCLAALIALAVAFQPNRRIWVVSNTYELADKVFREIYKILVTELKIIQKGKRGKASLQQRYIETPYGTRIEAKSCENRDSLVGESLDLLIWDEAGITKQAEDIWNQELRPCLMDREGSAIFISTPRGKYSFLYDMYQWGKSTKEEYKDWKSFRFTSYSNTIENGGHLKKEEIDAIRAQVPEIKFRQECLADFEAVQDSCFPHINEEIQYVPYEFDPKNGPVYATMDFNFATPCTTLYAQLDRSGNIMFFKEFFKAGITVHEQAKQLLEVNEWLEKEHESPIKLVTADIAGEQRGLNGRSAWDDLADWGIFPIGRKQEIQTGLDMIRLWMEYPLVDLHGNPVLYKDEEGNEKQRRINKLFISYDCPNLWTALNAARFKKNKQSGVLEDVYEKDGKCDGPLDAMRYLMVYLFHDSQYQSGLIPVRFG